MLPTCETSLNEPLDRPRRFALTDRHALTLTVEWENGGAPTSAAAGLLDISTGGVKLSLDSHLKLHQAISLKIVCSELKLDLTVSAKVCWLRAADDDHWTAGCSFVPELSPAAQETLFASGLVERRIFSRQPIKLVASAQWELDPARFDVELLDVSTGGVCIQSPRPGKIGARMVVVVPAGDGREVPIAARAQWQIADGSNLSDRVCLCERRRACSHARSAGARGAVANAIVLAPLATEATWRSGWPACSCSGA